MTVKTSLPVSEPQTPAAPAASQAWQNVLARMNDFGAAIEEWTKAASSEADTKQKFEQIVLASTTSRIRRTPHWGGREWSPLSLAEVTNASTKPDHSH